MPVPGLEATTGLRSGEPCALWWRDFDLDAARADRRPQHHPRQGAFPGYVRKRNNA
ncbi:MAG TPA: hypothetical protein VGC06_17215 [Actinomycetes bacterium]